jgi:Cu/Zn superoxide dismutase
MSRFATSATRRVAISAVALTAAAGLAAALPASAHDAGSSSAGSGDDRAGRVHGETLLFQSPLSDLQPTTAQPLDDARGTLRMTLGEKRSGFVLSITGIERSAAGTTYGAHLHSGPCVPGDGAAAGPHYNSANPPVVDDDHEVWLDFTVTDSGKGRATAVVPFVPVHGARSVVVHEEGTDPVTGAAGARLACMPVVW